MSEGFVRVGNTVLNLNLVQWAEFQRDGYGPLLRLEYVQGHHTFRGSAAELLFAHLCNRCERRLGVDERICVAPGGTKVEELCDEPGY